MKVQVLGFASILCVASAGLARSALADGESPYLTVSDSGNCTLFVNGEAAAFGEIPYSETTTVELKPNSGYEFIGWNGAVPFGTATNNPVTIRAGKVRTISAFIRPYAAPQKCTSTGQTATWGTGWAWPNSKIPGPNDDVVLDGSRLTAPGFVTCRSLTIKNGGRLAVGASVANVDVAGFREGAALKGIENSSVESASLLIQGDVILETGGQLAVCGQSWTENRVFKSSPFRADVRIGGNLTITNPGSKFLASAGPTNDDFTVAGGAGFVTVDGTISVGAGSSFILVSEWRTGGSVFVRASSFELAEGGTVSADERGFAGTKISTELYLDSLAPGLGYGMMQGGGYGGAGYYASWSNPPSGYGTAYGSLIAPILPGAPGGCRGNQYWDEIAPGGGLVRIRAKSMSLAGTVSANGSVDALKYYGGSGGGIWLTTSTKDLSFAQTVQLMAKGGNATYNRAHGGGGRIAITKNINDETEKYMAENGAFPKKRRVRDIDQFHEAYPGVTVDVSSPGGEANKGTFAYIDGTDYGLCIILR